MVTKYVAVTLVFASVLTVGMGATSTISWQDADPVSGGQYVYNVDGSKAATDSSWLFSVYAHSGVSTDVSTWAGGETGGGAGTFLAGSALLGTSTWDDNAAVLNMGDLEDGTTQGSVAGYDASLAGQNGWNIYVMFTDDDASHVGFIWNADWTMPDDSVNPGNLVMDIAEKSISVNGAGTWINDAAHDNGWAATNAVPEPGTMALFAIGILTMGARMRRKKQ